MKGLEYPYYAFLCLLVLLTIPSDEVARQPIRQSSTFVDEDETKPLLLGTDKARRASEYTRKVRVEAKQREILNE